MDVYGKLFIIKKKLWYSVSDSKMYFRWLALKNVHFLHPSLISILVTSSGSFNVKNDNIHTFFPFFWLQILNFPASLQNKNTWIELFPWKRSVLQNPD